MKGIIILGDLRDFFLSILQSALLVINYHLLWPLRFIRVLDKSKARTECCDIWFSFSKTNCCGCDGVVSACRPETIKLTLDKSSLWDWWLCRWSLWGMGLGSKETWRQIMMQLFRLLGKRQSTWLQSGDPLQQLKIFKSLPPSPLSCDNSLGELSKRCPSTRSNNCLSHKGGFSTTGTFLRY